MITRIGLISMLVACTLSPATASECETRATVDWLVDKVTTWGAEKKAATLAKFDAGLAQAANTPARETTKFIYDQFKQIAERTPVSTPFAAIQNAHAVDYNDKIDRYQCEATMVPDPKLYSDVLLFGRLGMLADKTDTTSMLIMGLAEEGNLPKLQQVWGMNRAFLEVQIAQMAQQTRTIRYTVQNTESGKLREIQSSSANN